MFIDIRYMPKLSCGTKVFLDGDDVTRNCYAAQDKPWGWGWVDCYVRDETGSLVITSNDRPQRIRLHGEVQFVFETASAQAFVQYYMDHPYRFWAKAIARRVIQLCRALGWRLDHKIETMNNRSRMPSWFLTRPRWRNRR